MIWILGLIGSINMFYYEYLWTGFALRNLASVSFGGWFWTIIDIATPWLFCLICLSQLREAARNRERRSRYLPAYRYVDSRGNGNRLLDARS